MSFKKDLIKGTKWTTIEQIGVVSLGLVRLAVLARLLKKETFGLFAIVLLIQGFTAIFADLGISVSLFHKKTINQSAYSTLYWLNILINTAIYILLILFIPLFTMYFKEPRLGVLIPIMGLNLFLLALGKHFQIYAQKELKFKSIAIINVMANLVGLIVAVYMAYNGYEIYALIGPVLITSLLISIAYFILMRNKYPLKGVFQFKEAKPYFKVGLYQSSSQIVGYIAKQLDIIIIGRLLSQELLGVYNLLKQFTMRIYALINTVMTKVAIPVFSTFNHDEDLLRSRFLKIVTGLSSINAILYSGIAFFAYEVLFIMYGTSYTDYILHFGLFSLIYYFSAIASPAGILVVAKGKTQFGLYWTIFRVLFSLPLLLLLGTKYQLIGILVATLLFSAQSMYTYWLVMIKRVQTNITFKDHFMSFGPSLIMGLVIFGLSSAIAYFIPDSLSFAFRFVLKILIFGLLGGTYIYLFRKQDINDILGLLNKKYKL